MKKVHYFVKVGKSHKIHKKKEIKMPLAQLQVHFIKKKKKISGTMMTKNKYVKTIFFF